MSINNNKKEARSTRMGYNKKHCMRGKQTVACHSNTLYYWNKEKYCSIDMGEKNMRK